MKARDTKLLRKSKKLYKGWVVHFNLGKKYTKARLYILIVQRNIQKLGCAFQFIEYNTVLLEENLRHCY